MKKKNVIITGIISSIIVILGISIPTYKVYSKVKSFDGYIYPTVKINGENMSGKTVEEAKKILEDKYQTPVGNKKINIKANDKTYTINYTQLGAKYDIDKVVKEAFDYGKDKNIIDKYKLIKNSVVKPMELSFTYNPKPIDDVINNIKVAVNKQPQNGAITKSGAGFVITPDVDGYKLKDVELKTNIIATINGKIGQDANVQANIETLKASKTKEKLQGVNTLVSTYSTQYGTISSPGRATNIQLATSAINGLLLMPGETFSFNGVVGERTAAKGYQAAPVDIGKTTGMGLGGGICQVSTTLYNSVIRAGVKSTVRMHHTIPSTYVPLGFDATVDYGNLDYQFKNTLSFPMYIESSSANGVETFNIYSDKSLLSKTYSLTSNVAPGGKNVKVYLQTIQNGVTLSNELIVNDTYTN
ncbi:VanW family protein [Clostridium akagii]|uniref:VanW family protein n=1 Tax=Clostridium akagii TaxID=91623 RepID=UPI00047B8615|nr:VanW family protein [Clostridium akagii]